MGFVSLFSTASAAAALTTRKSKNVTEKKASWNASLSKWH